MGESYQDIQLNFDEGRNRYEGWRDHLISKKSKSKRIENIEHKQSISRER